MTMSSETTRPATPRADEKLLNVDAISTAYGKTNVLNDLSFSAAEGETVGLIGRNGAGKTTTLRSIVGDPKPYEGQITFDHEDITDFSPIETAKRGISVIPQNRRTFPELTVEENLIMGQIGGTDRGKRYDLETIYSLFENLDERRHTNALMLSGGEKQMLSIARALMTRPRLLLLDEPVEGLAPKIVQQLQEVIGSLQDRDVTMVLVEQNVDFALQNSDYVYIIDNGTVVHSATPDDLRANQEILNRHLGVG